MELFGVICLMIGVALAAASFMLPNDIPDKNTTHTYEFPMVSATATVIGVLDGKMLVGLREETSDAYPGTYCFTGGFLNAKSPTSSGETLEMTAIREFAEETNIDITKNLLEVLYIDSNPLTDPRGHVINVCYLVDLTNVDISTMSPGDDITALRFITPDEIPTLNWAFNHEQIANMVRI